MRLISSRFVFSAGDLSQSDIISLLLRACAGGNICLVRTFLHLKLSMGVSYDVRMLRALDIFYSLSAQCSLVAHFMSTPTAFFFALAEATEAASAEYDEHSDTAYDSDGSGQGDKKRSELPLGVAINGCNDDVVELLLTSG